jgi:hypothetical protein
MLKRLFVLPAAAGLLALSVSGASAAAGASWTTVPIPDINGAAPNLLSVSCTAPGNCVAVGFGASSNPESFSDPVAESWNGTAWTPMSVPIPAQREDEELTSVSCASADDCMAVGKDISTDKQRTPQTLTELWNGSTWTIETAALTQRTLASVSCASPDFCAAEGVLSRIQTGDEGYIELWNGSAWSAAATIPDAARDLSGIIACPTTAGCYLSGEQQVYYWGGGTGVTTQPLAVPPGGGDSWAIGPISCTAAQSCTAVGGNDGTPLAEAWNGTAWSIEPTRAPAKTASSTLASVSCASAASCTAVGSKTPAHQDVDKLFAERWNGSGDWGAANLPAPEGSDGGQFYGISCTTTANCMAIEQSYDSTQGWFDLAYVLQPSS